MGTYTTPKTLVLPQGKYQISTVERVIKKKWKLPIVYIFAKWSDGYFTPSRQVLLDRDLKLCAKFKIALRSSLQLWGENAWGVMTSTLNRFNEICRKYPALGILLSLLLFVLSIFLKLFKYRETDLGDFKAFLTRKSLGCSNCCCNQSIYAPNYRAGLPRTFQENPRFLCTYFC